MRARLHAVEKLRRGVPETRIHDHFAEAKVAERHHPVALAVRRAVSNRPVHVLFACAGQASGLVARQQQQAHHSGKTHPRSRRNADGPPSRAAGTLRCTACASCTAGTRPRVRPRHRPPQGRRSSTRSCRAQGRRPRSGTGRPRHWGWSRRCRDPCCPSFAGKQTVAAKNGGGGHPVQRQRAGRDEEKGRERLKRPTEYGDTPVVGPDF